MDQVNEIVNKLRFQIVSDLEKKIKKSDLIAAFTAGMDNAIYNYPSRENSKYARTENLKKSIRYTRMSPTPANPELKINIYVSEKVLASLPNARSKNRPYGLFTAFDKGVIGPKANNTASGIGWYPLAQKSIMEFILKDALKHGV